MNIDAVLPAGGRITGEFAREAGAEVKALIVLNGAPLLQHVIRAMRGTGRIRRIVVVGPPELAGHPAAEGADAVLPEGDTGPENIFQGVAWLNDHSDGAPPGRVVIATTDLPFLDAGTVIRVLDACPPDAAIGIPLVTREEYEARYPGSQNEYVPLTDGHWTMGCVFVVDPAALLHCRARIDQVFAARKSQLRMARLLGAPFLLRYLFRRLAVPHIVARCSSLLGCQGAVLRGCGPEIAFDIDLPWEYRYARQHTIQEAQA